MCADPDLFADEAAEAAWVLEQEAEAREELAASAPVECDQCGDTVRTDDTEEVTLQTCRQTHSSPAEYEVQRWCTICRTAAEYLSDPDNEAYERARASGWED